jgi:hypothetical protein
LTLEPATLDGGPHEAAVVAIGNDAVRTVARRTFRFETGDPTRSCLARLAADEPLAWDKTGRILVSAEGAESIEARWGARSLGRVVGSAGEIQLDPRVIGPGLSKLQAIARYADGATVRSPWVELRVAPPSGDDTPRKPGAATP